MANKATNGDHGIRDFVGGIADLTRAIRLDPTDANAYCRRGLIRFESGAYLAAIDDWTKAISLNPADAWAHRRRGFAWYKLRDYPGAIADLTEAIRLDPTEARAHCQRGYARYKFGDYAGAISDLTESIRLDPTDARALCHRGYALRVKGDYKAAIADLTEAIQLDPADAYSYAHRGWAYFDAGDSSRAMKDLNKAIQLNSTIAWFHRQRGTVRNKTNKLADAIANWTEAIHQRPINAYHFAHRAIAYNRIGDHARAAKDLDRAFQLNPHFICCLRNRRSARRKFDDLVRAVADYTAALQSSSADTCGPSERHLTPDNSCNTPSENCCETEVWPITKQHSDRVRELEPVRNDSESRKEGNFTVQRQHEVFRSNPSFSLAHYNQGRSYYEAGDLNSAWTELTRAIRFDRTNALAFGLRGLLCIRTANTNWAITDFTRAIELGLTDEWVYANRGRARVEIRDFVGAVEDLTEAVRLGSATTEVYPIRGLARVETRDYAGAIADLTEAIRLNPRDALSYRQRGYARIKTHNFVDAVADLTEAIRLNPADPITRRLRGYARNESDNYVGARADWMAANHLESRDDWAFPDVPNKIRSTENLAEIIRSDLPNAQAFASRGESRYKAGDIGGAIEDWTHSDLRLRHAPAEFVARLTGLCGVPPDRFRIVLRSILAVAAMLEATREQWESRNPSDDIPPDQTNPLLSVLRLGSQAAEVELGLPVAKLQEADSAPSLFRWEPLQWGEANDRHTNRHSWNQAFLRNCFIAMCEEGFEAVRQRHWPRQRFWNPLRLLVENPMFVDGGWILSNFECLPADQSSAFLRCAIGRVRTESALNRSWLSETVVLLAKAIYTQESFHDMPILADALQDAGCDDEELLAHCREPHHCCGCWILDGILGR